MMTIKIQITIRVRIQNKTLLLRKRTWTMRKRLKLKNTYMPLICRRQEIMWWKYVGLSAVLGEWLGKQRRMWCVNILSSYIT